MKRKKIDNQVERRLLTAMVMSREFLSQTIPVMELDLIESSHFRQIAKWCVDYFEEYNDAPKRNIETIYHAWAEGAEDSRETDAVHDLLEDLSEDYEDNDPINVPYLLDKLRAFLNRKNLERLQDNLGHALHTGREEDAQHEILNYKPIELLTGTGIDPFNDEAAWERAFSKSVQPLIEFPGDAGKFLNPALTRDSLIGIQGPEKRGKTWWCIEFVARALKERRRVAFFQVGDLSEHQVMLRLGQYFTGRPSRKDLCGEVLIPEKIQKPKRNGTGDSEDDDYTCLDVTTYSKTFTNPISKQSCRKAFKKFMRGNGLNPNKTYLKVSIHANSSINVRGICSILDRWELSEGFIPDVIVIDYADILAPEDPGQQTRDQVNDTWKALRRLSQDRHCAVIVPTQADAQSYDKYTQDMRNFSEDKRKMAHVTGMLGLNQTEDEKDLGIMRLNWIALRESPFKPSHCLWVAQCLSIGKAFYCATL